jgi:hypothetical protein
MTKFADQLFDDLMREHGAALADTMPPATAPARRPVTARRTLIAAGGGVVAAGAIAATAGVLVAGGATPAHVSDAKTAAYTVTKNADGAITLAVYQKSGYAGANARLRQLDDGQVVVVPVEAGCPTIGSLPAPPVSGVGKMISLGIGRSTNGSITVNAQGIPAGDILVVGIETTAQGSETGGGLTSAPAPSCLSLPPVPAGNGSSLGGSFRVG